MRTQNLKRFAFTTAFGLGLVVAPGLSSLSSVQAQDGRYGQNRRNDGRIDRNQNGTDDRYESNRGVDRNRNGVNDRYETNRGVDRNRNGVNDRYERNRRVDRNRNGVNDRYENNGRYDNRGYGNDGYYGNNGNYGNSSEEQKGYRDGLRRGREDAQSNRRADPNNSSHFQKGSQPYREGFRRGFFESYRQYSGRGW
jgi:hypothetical protein